MIKKFSISKNCEELIKYMEFAFPQRTKQLTDQNRITHFVTKWETYFLKHFSTLMKSDSSNFWDEEEKRHTLYSQAMCVTYNALAVELENLELNLDA